MKIILGIDPGTLRAGYGVVATDGQSLQCLTVGTIHLSDKMSLAVRLAKLSDELSRLIAEYKPHEVAVENIFLGKNADSAFKLGHARGVCLLEAARVGLPVAEYATRQVKKVLTGNGAAEKEQVKFMVERLLNIQSDSLDATDALAVAICHAREVEVSERLARQPMTRNSEV